MESKVLRFKKILTILFFLTVGVLGVVFTVLYVNTFDAEFLTNYSSLINAISVLIFSILTILTIVFFNNNKEFIYKLFLCVIATITISIISLYILKKSGLFDKIHSIEEFREYISSFGSWTIIVFIVCQFLQVVVLPIPSFITVGAGVLLFGPFLGAVFSCIGIILGSICAFFVGRLFGYNIVKWLIGEKALNKGLNAVKGKDKVILTFMFLFPFFPDDVLCFVAGITTMSSLFFISMIIIVRIVCIFISSYSMNNSIIPYDTWWGILLWILFFILHIVLVVLFWKRSYNRKM